MKPSTKLAKILISITELFEDKYGKKMHKNARIGKVKRVVKRTYTKRNIVVNQDPNVEVINEPVIKRGRGRPRKVQPIDATTHPNTLNLTPAQQAKIDEIKKKIAALSATIPADRGE